MSLPDVDSPHYASWPCRLYGERHLQSGGSLERSAVELADLLAERLGRRRLAWHIGAFPAHELPEEGAAAAEDLRIGRQKGIPAIVANDPTDWDLFLAAQESLVEQVQYLDISLPGPLDAQWLEVMPMMTLVRDLATTFESYIAFTEDAALQRAFLRDRPERLARAQTERASITLAPDAIAESLTPGGGSGLDAMPELRHPVEIDRSAVPSAVYWINWWSSIHVDTLGADTVREAGWEHVLEGADGSLTLATGERPPDLGDAAAVARLAALVRSLGLRAAQDAHITPQAL